MGYHKCSAPGCKSVYGRGKLFKQLPKNPALAELWLKNFPKELRVTKSLAICEDHFDPSQFERPRQDGKKKLKFSAVPFSNPPARIPFGNLTNSLNCKPANEVRPITKPVLEHTAAEALVAFSEQLWVAAVNNETETEMDASFNPVFNSTSIFDDSVSELASQEGGTSTSYGQLDSQEVGNGELDEATGLFKVPLQPESSSAFEFERPYEKPEIEIQFVASWSNSGAILDETTGHFIFTSDSHDSQSLEESNYAEHRAVAIDAVLDLVAQGQSEVERMRKLLEEKDETISQLQSEVEFLGGGTYGEVYFKKYEAARKENSRLREYIKRLDYSPWLSESQMKRLRRCSNRNLEWEIQDIRDGLILKMKCGSSGYMAFVQRFPFLPSLSVLKETVQFVKFESGILDSVFDMIETMLKDMPANWTDCELVMDEMALNPEERWCPTLRKMIGMATLPGHTGLAKKGLVFLLAGIQRRWKMPVAVYLCSKREAALKKNKDNVTGKAYGAIVDTVVARADKAGANIVGITSDMGADNLALWRLKGIGGGRNDKNVISSFPHPARQGDEIFVLPDAVHLMKSIKTAMETNKIITLPQDIVEEEGLPTAIVDYQHIDDLFEYESGNELKIAFRLRENNIHVSKHFKKMNVGTTKAVLNHRTGVGLTLLAEAKQDPSYHTTGWFIILLNTFFQLVLCRHRGMAVSQCNLVAFEKATSLIARMGDIFHRMKIGDGVYKPTQRGMRVLCNSLLGVTDKLLIKNNYKFVMLGRFTSDCIENLFSCIRLCQSIPNAAMFYQCLKVITLAQYSEAVRGSNYDFDGDHEMSGDFLELARERARERAMVKFFNSLDEMAENTIRRLVDKDYLMLNYMQKMVVYDMAGSVIAAILKARATVCERCIGPTQWQEETPHPYSVVTHSKEYVELQSSDEEKPPLQIYVSDFVFHAILTAEISFRLYREKTRKFEHADVLKYFVENLMYIWTESSCIPNCHDLGRKILTTFIDGRLKEFGKLLKQHHDKENQRPAVDKSSRSIAGHNSVQLI